MTPTRRRTGEKYSFNSWAMFSSTETTLVTSWKLRLKLFYKLGFLSEINYRMQILLWCWLFHWNWTAQKLLKNWCFWMTFPVLPLEDFQCELVFLVFGKVIWCVAVYWCPFTEHTITQLCALLYGENTNSLWCETGVCSCVQWFNGDSNIWLQVNMVSWWWQFFYQLWWKQLRWNARNQFSVEVWNEMFSTGNERCNHTQQITFQCGSRQIQRKGEKRNGKIAGIKFWWILQIISRFCSSFWQLIENVKSQWDKAFLCLFCDLCLDIMPVNVSWMLLFQACTLSKYSDKNTLKLLWSSTQQLAIKHPTDRLKKNFHWKCE